MSESGITLLSWRPQIKNSLRGFATIRLRSGLIIHDVVVLSSHGKAWVTLPGKPIIDSEGQAQRDRETGKQRYATLLEWSDRGTADRFSVLVVDAVEAQHPGAVRAA